MKSRAQNAMRRGTVHKPQREVDGLPAEHDPDRPGRGDEFVQVETDPVQGGRRAVVDGERTLGRGVGEIEALWRQVEVHDLQAGPIAAHDHEGRANAQGAPLL